MAPHAIPVSAGAAHYRRGRERHQGAAAGRPAAPQAPVAARQQVAQPVPVALPRAAHQRWRGRGRRTVVGGAAGGREPPVGGHAGWRWRRDANVVDVDNLDGLAVQHAPSRDAGSHQPIREPLIGLSRELPTLCSRPRYFPGEISSSPSYSRCTGGPFGLVGSVIFTRIFLRSIGVPVCASRASQLACSSASRRNRCCPLGSCRWWTGSDRGCGSPDPSPDAASVGSPHSAARRP